MKQNIGKLVVAGAMVLAVSGVARAHDDNDDRKACRNSTLDGLYVFTASGFNIVAGVAQPKAIVELIDFHGDGKLTVPAATVSINGVISRSVAGWDRDVHGRRGLYRLARVWPAISPSRARL